MPHRRHLDLYSAVTAARQGDLYRVTQPVSTAAMQQSCLRGQQQRAEPCYNLTWVQCRLIALSSLPVLPTTFKELRCVDKQLSNPIILLANLSHNTT